MELHFSLCSKRIKGSEIREVLKYTRLPGVISFAGGLPDPSLFPLDDISRITSEVLKDKGFLALQYGPTQGESEMLDALIYHMEMFGEKATRENLCVTSSSQQGLDLVALTHLDPNDEVVMELPSYLGAIQAFERSGAIMHGIPLEADGMNMDMLEELVARKEREGVKLRFIYVIPDYQNPAGVVMSLPKRRRLLEISKHYQIPVIEDSPYRVICFCGEVLPSLWTLSGGEGVIQLKTFSKMLFPGMRMGWITAEAEAISKLALMKQSVDLCTPTFNQLILARFITENRMKETIGRAVSLYRRKNEVMLGALREFMPDYVHWTEPDGGMFLWVTLPEGWNAADMIKLAADKGVVFVTGRPFHCNEQGANTLRLNYSFPSLEQIRTGIERLAQAIREYAAR